MGIHILPLLSWLTNTGVVVMVACVIHLLTHELVGMPLMVWATGTCLHGFAMSLVNGDSLQTQAAVDTEKGSLQQ